MSAPSRSVCSHSHLLFELTARQQMQTRSCAALWTPPRSINASHVFERQLNRTQPDVGRKVWSAIVFGFELEMLRLHQATLADAVDGFLVTEADTCFQTASSKPLVLSDALSRGALPAAVAAKTFVRVVRYADAEQFLKTRPPEEFRKGGRASGFSLAPLKAPSESRRYSTRFFQAYQRYSLLELLAAHAAADDLVFVADVDEIADPQFVARARSCAPFPRSMGARDIGMVVLRADEHKFGAHCYTGPVWYDGPRLYSVGWLVAKRAARMSVKEFDAYRTLRTHGFGRDAVGGRHLTSWGSRDELVRKITTFGAANRFGKRVGADALDPRIDACVARADLLYDRGWKSTPCHKADDDLGCSPTARLSGWRRALRRTCARNGRTPRIRSVAAPPLIERPGDFPASWFEHLHTCAAGTPRPNCTREARTRWARTVPGLRPRRRGKNVGK